MDRLFKSSLSRYTEGWVSIWTGHQWKVDFRNPCHRWMVYDRYADGRFLKWAQRNLSADAVIVDSGSNIGQFLPYYSLIAAKGRILAFEPASALVEWIQECVTANHMNVEVIAKGLGDKEMDGFLSDPGGDAVKGLWGEVVSDSGEPIHLTVLEKELSERGIQHVSLWKLDVEGYEVEALRGAGDVLAEQRIGALYIEMAIKRNNNRRILEYMTANGYRAFEFGANGRITPLTQVRPYQIDALFLPV